MSEVERGILRQFAVELKRDVIPSEVLPYLLCLTEDDCEQIQREEDRKGPRAAVATLLDRVKKRLKQGAFKEFSSALGKTGCSHLQESLENALGKYLLHMFDCVYILNYILGRCYFKMNTPCLFSEEFPKEFSRNILT